MKKYLVLIIFAMSGMVYAMPTILISGLQIESDAINTDKLEQNSLNSAVYKKIPKFSSEIRGSLIKTGKFKVINTKLTPLVNINESTNDRPVELDESSSYYLVGVVHYIDENQDSYPIQGSDNLSMVYSFEVGADFKLVRVQDKVIMASFSANGVGKDVKIINSAKLNQTKWHNNYAKVVSAANKDLAHNVESQMLEQFNFVIDSEQKEREASDPKVVTDVKVYN